MATVITTDDIQTLLLKYLLTQGIGGGGGGGGCMYTPCATPPYCQLGIPCGQGCAWPQCCGQNPEPPIDNGVSRSCSDTSIYNNTYFVDPSTPQIGACTLTVKPLHSDICQMRLDFINLELTEPDWDGKCITDLFTVTGGYSALPTLCGSISGQHMYVDVDPSVTGALKLTIDRSADSTTSPNWDIKITQISCNSRYRAPSGCLQYYTETSGTINSFNFKQSVSTHTDGTREIANLDYGICVQAADGYCGIIWQRNTNGGNFGFTTSIEVNAMAPALVGDPAASSTGTDCTTDYVVIPGGVDDTGVQNDRYCGAGFPNTLTSTSKPFVLYYHTDADEALDTDNRGFSLNYRQTTTCY